MENAEKFLLKHIKKVWLYSFKNGELTLNLIKIKLQTIMIDNFNVSTA